MSPAPAFVAHYRAQLCPCCGFHLTRCICSIPDPEVALMTRKEAILAAAKAHKARELVKHLNVIDAALARAFQASEVRDALARSREIAQELAGAS